MFTLDIETVPDEMKIGIFDKFHLDKFIEENGPPKKSGEYPEGYERYQAEQMSLLPPYARLAGLGFWLEGEEAPTSIMVGDSIRGQLVTEEMLLKKFWWFYLVDKKNDKVNHGPCVGFNVISFDVRIIRLRSMHYGIQPSIDLRGVKPWETDKLFDLAHALYLDYKRLDMKQTFELLCGDVDIPERYTSVVDFNGGMVYDELRKEGGVDTVRLYQEYDVWREHVLAHKIMTYF